MGNYDLQIIKSSISEYYADGMERKEYRLT